MKRKTRIICLSILVFITSFVGQISSQSALYSDEFSLNDVTLLESPFKKAMDLNIQTLLSYDLPRLLQPYYKQSGLYTNAIAFSNWAGLDGHVGGHYLSALAIHYAASKDLVQKSALKSKMDLMLKELKLCQDASTKVDTMLTGYLGGVPDSKVMWTGLEKGVFITYNNAWVPWYNLHKMYSGLRDAWLYTGDATARTMFLKFCDWGIKITKKLNVTQMQSMLDKEYGGMNEVFADAYQMTGDIKYLDAAKRFTHTTLLNGMISKNSTYLNNIHANTQVPKVIGFQRTYETSPSLSSYSSAAEFFWNDVVNNRSLAFGGNSRNEYFIATSASEDYITYREGPESCNTYNMLKLSEDLFRKNQEAKYVDFYEQALYNHILSTQHPEHGGYVYFTPARPRHYRVYSAVNKAMWCCVGSGMENHGKYGQFIYTHRSDSLYVNLFIASRLEWKSQEVIITQNTKFPYEERTKLTVNTPKPKQFKLFLRHPSWISVEEYVVKINGEIYTQTSAALSYLSIERTWNDGDLVSIELPMKNTLKQLPNVEEYVALMHGPILLGAKTGKAGLTGLIAGEGRSEHIPSGELYALNEAPVIIGDRANVLDSIKVLNADSLTFTAPGVFAQNYDTTYKKLVLQPFFSIHDARYMMYWMQLTKEEYAAILKALADVENEKINIEAWTTDQINCGEQQPDQDHNFKGLTSYTGTNQNKFYRDARSGGWFSYEMDTKGQDTLKLRVTYWGNETGNRAFDIIVEKDTIFTENIGGKWGLSEFKTVDYVIPVNTVKGKSTVVVKFDAKAVNTAGGVYHLRLMKDVNRTSLNDRRTIIVAEVDAGLLTSESKFAFTSTNSNTGTHNSQTWRDARTGGYIRYTLPTKGLDDLFLRVRYWGNESGGRNFDIIVDGDTIAKENITGKWNSNSFQEVDYAIPAALLKGKSQIVVNFKARANNMAGGLFYVWLFGREKILATGLKSVSASGLFDVISSPEKVSVYSSKGMEGDKIRLFNLNGELVYSAILKGNSHEINTSSLIKKQSYILLYSGMKGTEACKFVVL